MVACITFGEPASYIYKYFLSHTHISIYIYKIHLLFLVYSVCLFSFVYINHLFQTIRNSLTPLRPVNNLTHHNAHLKTSSLIHYSIPRIIGFLPFLGIVGIKRLFNQITELDSLHRNIIAFLEIIQILKRYFTSNSEYIFQISFFLIKSLKTFY